MERETSVEVEDEGCHFERDALERFPQFAGADLGWVTYDDDEHVDTGHGTGSDTVEVCMCPAVN